MPLLADIAFADIAFADIALAEMDWQPIVAYGLIALAAAWLLRRMWRVVRRASRSGGRSGEAGGGCGGCLHNTPSARDGQRPKAKPLIQLKSTPRD